MAEVQVGLRAVVEHVDLTMLVRTHRPRVDVDVRVELLEPDPQPSLLQQHADRGARQPFPSELTTPPVTKICLAIAPSPIVVHLFADAKRVVYHDRLV